LSSEQANRRAGRLVIVGAGRHGRELEAYCYDVRAHGIELELLGFIDEFKEAGAFGSSQVLGDFTRAEELARAHGEVLYLAAAGDNTVRRRLAEQSEAAGLLAATLIHPTAHVGPECQLGEGTVLAPGVIATRAITIGRHGILNVSVTISHDCVLGDFVNLNPGVTVCGDVEIGDACYVGAGSTIIDKVSIGPDSVVGAGSVVIDNLPAAVLALGVPARVVRELHSRPKLV
jgi:sugar O-acyltransferase (sialic acid O-acetyltransferase NeuD family)